MMGMVLKLHGQKGNDKSKRDVENERLNSLFEKQENNSKS